MGLPLTFRAVKRPGFLPGRVAGVYHEDEEVGVVGEVHPEVMEKLSLITPLALLELSLEPLLR